MSHRHVHIGRTLHLIDLENLVGLAPREATAPQIIAVAQRYRERLTIAYDDQVIVGHNPSATWLFASTSAFPGGRVRVRGHEHGGETAILELVEPHWIAARFGAVVVGSGDRAFITLALTLRNLGVHVTVASRTAGLHHQLAQAADVIVPIDAISSPAAA